MDSARWLLRHPRTQQVRIQPFGRRWSFRYRGRAVPGLHPTIRRRWVPARPGPRKSPRSGVRRATKGLGIRVDNNLSQLAKTGRLDAKGRQCPYTVACKRWLQANGMQLVGAQVPLYSATYGWATAIDLLAVHNDTLYILEVKTGRGALQGTKRLRAPLQAVRDTDGARHALQLAMMDTLLHEEYGLRGHRALLVYLQQSAATRQVNVVTRRYPRWCSTVQQRRTIWHSQPPKQKQPRGRKR